MSNNINTAYKRGYIEGREGYCDRGHEIYKNSAVDAYRTAYQNGFKDGRAALAEEDAKRAAVREYRNDIQDWLNATSDELTVDDLIELFRLFSRFPEHEANL